MVGMQQFTQFDLVIAAIVYCLLAWLLLRYLKFIYFEKATIFREIFPLLLTVCTVSQR